MKSFNRYLNEKNKGLWDNIHAKRKRGEKMRKPGEEGAPTDADFKRSQAKEAVEEKTLTPAEKKKREEIAKAMERDNPGMDMKKKMAIATWQAKKVAETYDKEPASPDEKSMAMRQAKFIQYVGDEIMEHLEQDGDFPEWMQNKLSELHQKAKDMHSTMSGSYEDDEDDMNETKLGEGLYHVEYGRSGKLTHQVVAKDAKDAHQKAMAHLKKKNPKLAHPDYADTFNKPVINHIKGNEPRADKYKTESTEIDEISLSHLSNTIAKSTGTKNIKTAMKPGEVKKGLEDLRKRLGTLGKEPQKEAVVSADKKPEKYVKPDGKVGIRMVKMDKKVIKDN